MLVLVDLSEVYDHRVEWGGRQFIYFYGLQVDALNDVLELLYYDQSSTLEHRCNMMLRRLWSVWKNGYVLLVSDYSHDRCHRRVEDRGTSPSSAAFVPFRKGYCVRVESFVEPLALNRSTGMRYTHVLRLSATIAVFRPLKASATRRDSAPLSTPQTMTFSVSEFGLAPDCPTRQGALKQF